MSNFIPDNYPPPHSKYLLTRGGLAFTATPCYGLHKPLWVVKTLSGEAPPELMEDGDEWLAIDEHGCDLTSTANQK